MLRSIAFIALLVGFQAQAAVLAKCTAGPRTLWASFGRAMFSGETQFRYFPVEISVFSDATELEERVLFKTFQDGLKIPVFDDGKHFGMDFTIRGVPQKIRVQLYSDNAPNSFIGDWATVDSDGKVTHVQAGCTIY